MGFERLPVTLVAIMDLTPFDDFLANIRPYQSFAAKLANKYGAEAILHCPEFHMGAAAAWHLICEYYKPEKDGTSKHDPFDYNQVLVPSSPLYQIHRTVMKLILSVDPKRNPDEAFAEANSTMGDFWSYYLHFRSGERVYEVGPGLAFLMEFTGLDNIYGRDLRLPYPSIYISMPKSAGLKDTDGHLIKGMFITENLKPLESGSPGKCWWILTITGEYSDFSRTGFFFSLDLPDDEPIWNAIHQKVAKIQKYPKSIQHCYTWGAGPSWIDQLKWAVNIILYATHCQKAEIFEHVANKEYTKLQSRAERAPKGSLKRRRLYDELKNLRPCRRILLGQSIPLPSIANDGSPFRRSPLTVRTMVTGHWRNQACGKNWSEHKTIWIMPFERGPRDAPEMNARRILDVDDVKL